MKLSTIEAAPAPESRHFTSMCTPVAALLILLFASPVALAEGTCNVYINADGSIQARRGEGDCWIQGVSHVSAGVYTVGVDYPVIEEPDPVTGAVVHKLYPGICTLIANNESASASSAKMSPDLKPSSAPQTIPLGRGGVVTYTVRTFAAATGPTLVPADQDFSILCLN